ncbi:MAG: 5-oxoprolinase subunit PxpB [Xanthomonadales bacterium]|nr:5-oxoprolinase subunit PxpB [Xanthomonadales bacterium]
MTAPAATGDHAAEPLGETVLLLRFGSRIDAGLNARVHRAAAILRAAALPGVSDIVPAYAALALHYDPEVWAYGSGAEWRHLAGAVEAVFARPPAAAAAPAKTLAIPVRYGGEHGPDLDFVAHRCGLTAEEVVTRHVAGEYTVAMLGFAPGFPYLLGLDPALALPRRAEPRLRVPTGSVAIGGAQTGIYPGELPGGWHLIGHTPLRLFDAVGEPPCPLAPGDRVRFHAIPASDLATDASP